MNWDSTTWQFVFECDRDYQRAVVGWYWLRIGFIKLLPKSVERHYTNGYVLKSEHYRGLILRVCFFWPIDRLHLD